MVGGILAGCDETPLINGRRVFRGMASRDAQMDFKGAVSNVTPEGAVAKPRAKGPVRVIIDELAGGIRSGLCYSGAENIMELQEIAQFLKISQACLAENGPHFSLDNV
jgi:IMP dehydrogenase